MSINATLLGQMITFAIFIWFTYRFVWPMIQSSMDDRKRKILHGLEAAKKGHEKLKQAENESKVLLEKAKKKCDTIIINAEKQAERIIDDARVGASLERKEILNFGYKEIKQEVSKVKIELHRKLSELIIIGAKKVLMSSISLENHVDILKKFTNKL